MNSNDPAANSRPTRRSLLKTFAGSTAAAMLQPAPASARLSAAPLLRLPVLAQPDVLLAYTGDLEPTRTPLTRAGTQWSAAGGVLVNIVPAADHSTILLESPTLPIQRLHLRWHHPLPPATRVLGDAWERSYGDLAWRPLEPERALPWYAILTLEGRSAGIGVKTGPAALAFWQVDPSGISLWLDVRNGSNGVRLGHQVLQLATIVQHLGTAGETPFAATQALCRAMAAGTVIPATRGQSPVSTIYGSNDWYYAYGNNTPAGILRDADLVASLAPAAGTQPFNVRRPFTVIDDGYQDPKRFPDMPGLAAGIRSRGVLPGLWIRPLRAPATAGPSLLLPNARWHGDPGDSPPLAYDPTIPQALDAIAAVATQACDWGFDLIKHDFTTFELFGQWGSQMGASPTRGNWHFHDRSLTNAQIVTLLYRRLREACGIQRIILGCNTIGHLSVGLFDASRTGDDVSGRQWERTRRTGINTLAFRLPQHRAFFSLDADCVPLTPDIPWSMTRQWLQLVASTGTVLLISPQPGAVQAEQRTALREAFAQCVQQAPPAQPQDWLDSRTPSQWGSPAATYNWILPEGEDPFPIGIQRGPD